jgi:hypothetical protein
MTNFEISNKSEDSDFLLFVHFVLANTHFKKVLKTRTTITKKFKPEIIRNVYDWVKWIAYHVFITALFAWSKQIHEWLMHVKLVCVAVQHTIEQIGINKQNHSTNKGNSILTFKLNLYKIRTREFTCCLLELCCPLHFALVLRSNWQKSHSKLNFECIE